MLLSIFLLTGCSGKQEDDLDRWIKERKMQIKGKVEPLPELKKYEPFSYNADNSLNDPFRGRVAAGKTAAPSGLQPDFKRPKEPLESFPLESLKFVGYLELGKKGIALIAAPDKTVYQVRTGNYIGQNYGLVTSLNQNEVSVKEMVQDGTGDFTERRVTINPQE
jgi:type IV pilus assembly protein PilP